MIFQCPGSSKFKQPAPDSVKCASCGEEVEIWTDEVEATCPKCKNIVTREGKQSCLDWCKYARECVGEEKYNKYMDSKAGSGKKSKERGISPFPQGSI